MPKRREDNTQVKWEAQQENSNLVSVLFFPYRFAVAQLELRMVFMSAGQPSLVIMPAWQRRQKLQMQLTPLHVGETEKRASSEER